MRLETAVANESVEIGCHGYYDDSAMLTRKASGGRKSMPRIIPRWPVSSFFSPLSCNATLCPFTLMYFKYIEVCDSINKGGWLDISLQIKQYNMQHVIVTFKDTVMLTIWHEWH